MTNNPDSKAPDRIWAGTGLYHDYVDDWSEGYWYNENPDFHVVGDIKEVEYTRTDAITPQQAAKVLGLSPSDISQVKDTLSLINSMVRSGEAHSTKSKDEVFVALGVLARLKSALPDIVREMIKPLEWCQEECQHTEWHSYPYKIKMHYMNVFTVSGWSFGRNPYETLDEAQEAANNHHRDQIIKSMGLGE